MKQVDYVYIETTNYCNLKCTFCNRDDVIGPLKHMDLHDFKILLERIKHYPIKEAKLMGMGEPFLHPKFDEICKLFKEYFPRANLISATNCQYTITPIFERALAYIDYLYFSIDGYETNYEIFRPPSKWGKLIKFLDIVSTLDRKGCKIAVNYVVNPGNIYDIDLVYNNIVKKYKLDELRLNIAQSWNPSSTIPLGYTLEQIEYLKVNWSSMIKGKALWDYKDCFWPQRGLYITVEGRVLMCCMNTAAESFGNIFKTDADSIRTSKMFQLVAEGCSANTPTEHCKTCSYKELAPLLTQLGVSD